MPAASAIACKMVSRPFSVMRIAFLLMPVRMPHRSKGRSAAQGSESGLIRQ
jgi:hypothetical protein